MDSNCCDNTIQESNTVSYLDYKILKQNNDNLSKQIDLKNEELSCKCEIISELELMIISLYSQYVEGGQEKAVADMGIKLADIYKKYTK